MSMSWSEPAPGVWRGTIGTRDAITLLDLAGAPPRRDALAAMGNAARPFAETAVIVEPAAGMTVLRFPLAPDEQLYGPGLQFKALDQRTRVFHLKVDHYGGKDNGRTHAPCPFYVSSRGYAVLINTARFVSFYMGSANRQDSPHPPRVFDRNTDRDWTAQPLSDAVEVAVPGNAVEIFVFGGPSPLEAVRRFILYSGGGCLPPRWGLGFWHRVPMLHTADKVVAEVAEFARHDVPLQVIGLEPGWHSRSYPCTYVWDKGRFPDPKGFCQRLLDAGVRVNLWENPYVSPESPAYSRLQPLSGSHTVWCGLVPDPTLPEAVRTLQELHEREHVDVGVSGYKLDECDGFDGWLWPDHATFPSGTTGEVMRQTYGLQWQKLTLDMFRKRNRRTYGLTRGSNAGSAAYPFAIYSDCYDFSEFLTGLCNSGFCGVLWTPEVRSARNSEEWVRRMQVVCFSPMAMINAWADGTQPWSFSDVESIVRDTMKLRLRLVPYLYSAFARYHFDGVPPFRAMPLEAPASTTARDTQGRLNATENPYAIAAAKDIRDQYMMGDSLLVAPVFPGQTSRQVVLPPGGWCDFETGEWIEGGRVIQVSPRLDQIPLFVRDGGIIPLTAPDVPGTLEVRHYGRAPGLFRLYDDDGETFDYEQGRCAWTNLTTVRTPCGGLQGQARQDNPDWASTWRDLRWRFMTE